MDRNDILPALIGPIFAVIVALTVGTFVWDWQTRRKRRIEVAEQCLIAFDKAAEVLASARNMINWVHAGKPMDTYAGYVSKRIDRIDGLSEAITLAGIHLGDDVVRAMRVVIDAWVETVKPDADPKAVFVQVEQGRPRLLAALKPYLVEKATAPPWDR